MHIDVHAPNDALSLADTISCQVCVVCAVVLDLLFGVQCSAAQVSAV